MSEGFYRPPSELRFDDLERYYAPVLPDDPATPILDVGCGHGRVLAFCMSRGHENVTGIDRDPEVLAWARDNVSERVEQVGDVTGYLRERRGAYGLVVLKDVLYYIPSDDVVEVLRAVRESLLPDGRIILEVFNGATRTGPYIAYKDPDVQWIPTEPLLRHYLGAAGFRDVSLRGRTATLRGPASWLFATAQWAWRLGLAFAFLVERGRDAQNPAILTPRMIGTARR